MTYGPHEVRSRSAAGESLTYLDAGDVRERWPALRFAPDAEISVGRDIKVTGDHAIALVREQNGNVSKLSLVRQSAQWRIDRVIAEKSG